MKIPVTKSLSYLNDFITINGFYVIIMIFSVIKLDIESRIYTIPTRLIVVVSMILLMILKRYKPNQDPLVYVFFLWFFIYYWFRIVMEMIIGTNETIIPPYEYLLYSIIYCFIPFLYYSQRRTEGAYEQIFKAVLVSGIIFSLVAIFMFFLTQKSGLFDRYLVGISPITISYVGSLVTGICFSRLAFTRENKNVRLLIVGLLIGICPLLIGGSRGPILALIVPLVFALIYKIRKIFSPKVLGYTILGIIMLFLALAIFGNLALERFTNIFKDLAEKTSDASRLLIWKATFTQFLHSPIWGDSIQLKGYSWPHNLSLEVLMSTGIIGYIPFLIMMCFGIYKSFRILKHMPKYIWLYTFFFQTLIMGMLSGTVYSDIWYWSSLAMIFAVDINYKNVPEGLQNTTLSYE